MSPKFRAHIKETLGVEVRKLQEIARLTLTEES